MANGLTKAIFKKRHLKFIAILVLFDAISTMIWYSFSDTSEWNPIMNTMLEQSLLLFIITKLAISFFAITLLSKNIAKKITQIGIGIILSFYIPVSILHYFVFLFLLSSP